MMMKRLKQAYSYLRYLFMAKTKYSIHSPFVYSLVTEVFEMKNKSPETLKISELRSHLTRSKRVLEVTDFGSGKGNKPYTLHFKTVGQIASGSSVSHKYGELLFRLVDRFRPETIIELGTSLGISTLYVAIGAPKAQVFTIEGCSTTSEIARENFTALGVRNIQMQTGRFDDVLPGLLRNLKTVDFAFIDGYHEYEPTKKYAEMILELTTENSVLVIDDIHWSGGMERVWNELCNNSRVAVSIDIYRFGMLFFGKGLSKQHFVIRYR
jgi:predicted O-methyltransferase YrrM